MSELDRIKQAMADGEHTDGDLEWCVDRIEELEARIDKALKHLPERSGMAMGFLLEDNEEVT